MATLVMANLRQEPDSVRKNACPPLQRRARHLDGRPRDAAADASGGKAYSERGRSGRAPRGRTSGNCAAKPKGARGSLDAACACHITQQGRDTPGLTSQTDEGSWW